jgi:hypothetical protein
MTTAIAQSEALEIGILFRKARGSMVESVRHLIEAGAKLTAIKKSLPHKSWLPWLAENADALGFESRATAAALMRLAAKCNVNDTFDEDEALRLSREVWGNAAPRLPKPQRDDDLERPDQGSLSPAPRASAQGSG